MTESELKIIDEIDLSDIKGLQAGDAVTTENASRVFEVVLSTIENSISDKDEKSLSETIDLLVDYASALVYVFPTLISTVELTNRCIKLKKKMKKKMGESVGWPLSNLSGTMLQNMAGFHFEEEPVKAKEQAGVAVDRDWVPIPDFVLEESTLNHPLRSGPLSFTNSILLHPPLIPFSFVTKTLKVKHFQLNPTQEKFADKLVQKLDTIVPCVLNVERIHSLEGELKSSSFSIQYGVQYVVDAIQRSRLISENHQSLENSDFSLESFDDPRHSNAFGLNVMVESKDGFLLIQERKKDGRGWRNNSLSIALSMPINITEYEGQGDVAWFSQELGLAEINYNLRSRIDKKKNHEGGINPEIKMSDYESNSTVSLGFTRDLDQTGAPPEFYRVITLITAKDDLISVDPNFTFQSIYIGTEPEVRRRSLFDLLRQLSSSRLANNTLLTGIALLLMKELEISNKGEFTNQEELRDDQSEVQEVGKVIVDQQDRGQKSFILKEKKTKKNPKYLNIGKTS